jgi:hypothetical protein
MQREFVELVAQEKNETIGVTVKVFRHFLFPRPEQIQTFIDPRKQRRYLRELKKEGNGYLFEEVLSELKHMLVVLNKPCHIIKNGVQVIVPSLFRKRLSVTKNTFKTIVKTCALVHRHAPSLVLRAYSRIDFLLAELNELLTRPVGSLREINSVMNTLLRAKAVIRDFWIFNHLGFLFTIPAVVSHPILLEEADKIMATTEYRDIMSGRQELAEWLDPVVAYWIDTHQIGGIYENFIVLDSPTRLSYAIRAGTMKGIIKVVAIDAVETEYEEHIHI